MARRVFFSFHYQRDVWRVNQIRNLPNVLGVAAAGFQDAGPWEEAKRKGDASIKKLIDDGLGGTSVTIVCIGYQTAQRKYVNYDRKNNVEQVTFLASDLGSPFVVEVTGTTLAGDAFTVWGTSTAQQQDFSLFIDNVIGH